MGLEGFFPSIGTPGVGGVPAGGGRVYQRGGGCTALVRHALYGGGRPNTLCPRPDRNSSCYSYDRRIKPVNERMDLLHPYHLKVSSTTKTTPKTTTHHPKSTTLLHQSTSPASNSASSSRLIGRPYCPVTAVLCQIPTAGTGHTDRPVTPSTSTKVSQKCVLVRSKSAQIPIQNRAFIRVQCKRHALYRFHRSPKGLSYFNPTF